MALRTDYTFVGGAKTKAVHDAIITPVNRRFRSAWLSSYLGARTGGQAAISDLLFPYAFHDQARERGIGFFVIDSGDPSMGCAYGRFIPTPAYSTVQQHRIRHRENWEPVPGLSAEEASGIRLECSGGFQIVDYSPEIGSEGIELHLLGITTPPYGTLVPDDLKNR